jgi:hypothetical protein
MEMEDEFFDDDIRVTDKAISYANEWNTFCPKGKEILINKGDVEHHDGTLYLVEPLIPNYKKFTNNTGWIDSSSGDAVLAMEAFSHYSYHSSGSCLLVCDLQGRYKKGHKRDRKPMKSRFELTDVAISSRHRGYGPTDMGEKGIESSFHHHHCNKFCHQDWDRPDDPRNWFQQSSGTSMMSSALSDRLNLYSMATFKLGLDNILEEDEVSESDY